MHNICKTTLLYAGVYCFFLSGSITHAEAQTFSQSSPDGKTVAVVELDVSKALRYSMLRYNVPLVNASTLGLSFTGGSSIGKKVIITSSKKKNHRETFAWPFGERDSITNHFNELALYCKEADGAGFVVRFRVFNDCIGFRYEYNPVSDTPLNIVDEHTSFQLARSYLLYQYNQETEFSALPVDTSLKKTCDLPATLASESGYISIGEAFNMDYTKAVLKGGTTTNMLSISLGKDPVIVKKEFISPWRTIAFSATAIGLHAFSDLPFRLTDPGTQDASRFRPGKLIRAKLTTKDGKACIDFAKKNNLQYILFDAGWYGKEFNSSSDPLTVIPAIDMQEVVAYGKKKNIGVILYVNYVGLKQKLDSILLQYQSWGIAGMKFGFVDGIRQQGITWLMEAVKKATDKGFIVDVHDNYKPTGISRKYPGWFTQEGIRGNEHASEALHNNILPYTRFLAGAADYTFCYPNANESFNRSRMSKNVLVSKAHQLALTVIYYSPLQAVFWYGAPEDYRNETEIEFFKLVPTVWNQSIYLKGKIGTYTSVARKNGRNWFIGSIAGLEDWNDSIPLSFLDKGSQYKAVVFEDDGEGSIIRKEMTVKKDGKIKIQIKSKGGQAIYLTPM